MKYTIAAAALLSLAACQNDDEFAPAYESDANAVIVEATANGIQTRVNTESNGSTWQNADKFKVQNISSNAITGKTEATYIYNATAFELDGVAYMVWADGENEFQAWFPANAATYTTFTLPSDQSTVENLRAADWMTATHKLAKPADKKLPLAFNHRLCKVTVTISGYNTQYTGTETVSTPVFTIPTTPTSGSEVTVQGNATRISGYMDASAALNAKPTLTAILMPGTYATDDTFLTLTVGGDNLTVKAPGLLTETGLEAAKAYTFNLVAGKNQLTISGISVEDWGKGDSLTGGTADETQS